MKRHRSEQNGRYGLPFHGDSTRQMGHLTDVGMMIRPSSEGETARAATACVRAPAPVWRNLFTSSLPLSLQKNGASRKDRVGSRRWT